MNRLDYAAEALRYGCHATCFPHITMVDYLYGKEVRADVPNKSIKPGVQGLGTGASGEAVHC